MKTKLEELYKQWRKLSLKKDLDGEKALEAVEQNGYALRYVKAQTEAVCLKAVEQDGNALRYMEEDIFKKTAYGN